MTDAARIASLQSELDRTGTKLKLAVASGNWRDAEQLSGQAVRLEQQIAEARAEPAGGSAAERNVVGRAFVNDGSKGDHT
jgi:hypothetical protein